MKDIEKAKDILSGQDITCSLVLGEKEYISTKSGIAPMMEFIKEGTDLKGFSAADKIIGKAAAMLFALANVAEVYGEVMSKSALPILKEHNIKYSFKILTDCIINRKKDGMCPMEETVMNIDDPKKAYKALCEKINELKADKTV